MRDSVLRPVQPKPYAKKNTTSKTEQTQKAPVTVVIDGQKFTATPAFDTFWRYASERQSIEDKRRAGEPQPWTDDRILKENKFCCVFRVADRGSQFVITEVIEKGSQKPVDVFFRVLLYSTFCKPATYTRLEQHLGPLTWARYDQKAYADVLEDALESGETIYTGAFQKVALKFGTDVSYMNHLILLEAMMGDDLLCKLRSAAYMADAFDALYAYPGMGDFSAFQLLLNLSYSSLVPFWEGDFVVAGVGACAGLRECFAPSHAVAGREEGLIRWMAKTQAGQFERLGVKPARLPGGREMTLVDIEHTLCEVRKYVRAKRGGYASRSRFVPSADALPARPVLPRAWADPKRSKVRIRPGGTHERAQKRYIIKRVLDRREDEDGEEEYWVDWLGYGVKDRTWEPAQTLREDVPNLVREFEEAQQRL